MLEAIAFSFFTCQKNASSLLFFRRLAGRQIARTSEWLNLLLVLPITAMLSIGLGINVTGPYAL